MVDEALKEEQRENLTAKINAMSQKEFETWFTKLHPKIVENPIENFVQAIGFLDTTPTPGQRVLFKLVFKEQLDPEEKMMCLLEVPSEDPEEEFKLIEGFFTEVELYEIYTGKVYNPEKVDRLSDISLVVGRRGSKTLSSSVLAIWKCIEMDWKPLLGKNNVATMLVMSHTKDFSDEIIDLIRSLIEESPILQRLIDTKKKNTASTINLKVPFFNPKTKRIRYSRVRIRTNAASSKSSRGSACPTILCDEIAFWGSDPNAKETDTEIIRAVRPSMAQFEGYDMMIKLSSPNIKQGVLYDTHKKFKAGKTTENVVVLQSPSWMFNNRIPKNRFYLDYADDPDNFDREFRANFTDSTSTFIMPEAIDEAVQKGINFIPPEDTKKSNITYFAAIDAAFKSDRFTFSLVGQKEGRLTQYVVKTWEGSKTTPVEAHEVAKVLSKIVREYGLNQIYSDQYAYQPLKEIFQKFGITLVEQTFTNTYKKKIYYNLKNLIHSHNLDLLDHPDTITELKQLQVEQSSMGTIRIGHPVGGKDDHADSLAISCYLAMEGRSTAEFGVAGLDSEDSKVRKDINGVAIDAPSAEMVGKVQGIEVIDNIGQYYKDEDGKWQKHEDGEEDDGDMGGGIAFA